MRLIALGNNVANKHLTDIKAPNKFSHSIQIQCILMSSAWSEMR